MSGSFRDVPAGILSSVRPRQWTKNLLVVAAPLAAGVISDSAVLVRVTGAFVAFCLIASAVYLFNDVCDVEADRRHPQKRNRAVASGQISSRTAVGASVLLIIAGLALGWLIDKDLASTLAIYLALQIAYALWLKHQAVVDIAIVSVGFLLRAIAGGIAADVPLSQWFLLVAAFGSLFMVAGKRYSELKTLGSEAGTRRILNAYSESYLRFVWSLAAAVSITAYSLWAFEIAGESHINWQAISIAPFVMGLLRYAVDVDRGLSGEPEDAILRDHVLQVIGLIWIATFALGVYQA